jgi:hypothetical protein
MVFMAELFPLGRSADSPVGVEKPLDFSNLTGWSWAAASRLCVHSVIA